MNNTGLRPKDKYNNQSDFDTLVSAAQDNSAQAQYWLAYQLYFGSNGVAIDQEQSKKWLIQAAANGNTDAGALFTELFQEPLPSAMQGESPGHVAETNENEYNHWMDRYKTVLVVDTETTGLDPKQSQIIDFCALNVKLENQVLSLEGELDFLVQNYTSNMIPPNISMLTGIQDTDLKENGIGKADFLDVVQKTLCQGRTLLLAYNAQFDLGFIMELFRNTEYDNLLESLDYIDLMTVFKDRADYPHKLSDAVNHYGVNQDLAHRAKADAFASMEIFGKMLLERDDLENYINLFGYNPKYGINGSRIPGIVYKPQPYNSYSKIYER